jgi:hypothetical protein
VNIIELLEQKGYPNSWIQGHHSRIVVDVRMSQRYFVVFSLENPDSAIDSGKYTKIWYRGFSEELAVAYFIDSENA